MDTYANRLIDALGGSTKVAALISAPLSTVHSWRRIGIPKSRLDHIKLAAGAADIDVDWASPPPSKREIDSSVAGNSIPGGGGPLSAIEAFCEAHDVRPTTFGRLAIGDGNLISNLRSGRSLTLKNARRVTNFMASRAEAENVEAA